MLFFTLSLFLFPSISYVPVNGNDTIKLSIWIQFVCRYVKWFLPNKKYQQKKSSQIQRHNDTKYGIIWLLEILTAIRMVNETKWREPKREKQKTNEKPKTKKKNRKQAHKLIGGDNVLLFYMHAFVSNRRKHLRVEQCDKHVSV